METIIYYHQVSLDKTVEYIAEHNHAFLGKQDYIRATIFDMMKDMTLNHKTWSGTMGFMLQCSFSRENLYSDYNGAFFNFYVLSIIGDYGEWKTLSVTKDDP